MRKKIFCFSNRSAQALQSVRRFPPAFDSVRDVLQRSHLTPHRDESLVDPLPTSICQK